MLRTLLKRAFAIYLDIDQNLNTTMRYIDINDTKLNNAVELVSV